MKIKKAVLLCAFGSSDIKGIEESIGILKKDIEVHLNFRIKVEIAFTSKIIVSKLHKKGYVIRDLEESLQHLHKNGFEEVIIQPIYMMDGCENLKLRERVSLYESYFSKLIINSNLFGKENNFNKKAINETAHIIKKYSEKYSNILIAGHGSKINNNSIYNEIKKEAEKISKATIYMATLEGKNSLEKAIEKIKKNKVKNILIIPIFLMKGRHIIMDISEGENSWRSVLESEGLMVECLMNSLLQYNEIRKLYIEMLDFSDNLQRS